MTFGRRFCGMAMLGTGIAFWHAGNTIAAPAAANAPDRSYVIKPDHEFAASSYVHTPLPPDAPIDEKSGVWVANLLLQVKQYYRTITVGSGDYSPAIYSVPRDQPTVKVVAARTSDPRWSFPPLQAQWIEVPLPDAFRPAAGTDKEAVVYQPSTGKYWEFWGMEPTGRMLRNSAGKEVKEWRAAWGGTIDRLATNPGYFMTTADGYKFGTTATGLPFLSGVMTIKEQQEGKIDHPLHFAIPQLRKGVWAFPAQRTDGTVDDVDAIPAGVTFRFPADIDFDAMPLHPYGRMVAKVIQRYGMILRDTAGAVVIYAENTAGRYEVDPYSGPGGILDCPRGKSEEICWPDSGNRLKGIPWDKLQAVKARLSQ